MPTLVIAIGNRLRGDDAVAHATLALLRPVESRICTQLTPELAADLTRHDSVLFLDADPRITQPVLRLLDESPAPPSFTHVCSPAEIVALARTLYGFRGHAFLCAIPAVDFSGNELSAQSRDAAAEAARMIGDQWPLSF